MLGRRPRRKAPSTSTSCPLLMGQPRSSKSTRTCWEMGVEASRVLMYSGVAYTAEVNSRTSLKLRSAWMPPAVAQAPIVTRKRDCLRTCWMRSASCEVVIEPSTSVTSYGPFTTSREASRKFAISTSPTTARSSSSQSRSDSWQPSHEANLNTASFGRATSHLPHAEEVPDPVVAEDRAVLAHEERAELAVPAHADRALHVALHRDEDVRVGHAALLQPERRVADHHLGPADERHRAA